MELKIMVIHPHDEIRSPICEILAKDNNSIQELREIPLDYSFMHEQNFDLIFAPLYDKDMSVTPIFADDKIDINNNPLLIAFTEDRNPKERYRVFISNAFDTIPLFCEEEYLLLRLDIYKTYRRISSAMKKEIESRNALTGLPNRNVFRRDLEKLIKESVENPGVFSVAILEIDFILPHEERRSSDKSPAEILKRAGVFLADSLRTRDSAYHIFPDQIAILMPGINELNVERASKRIKEALWADLESIPNKMTRFLLNNGATTFSPSEDTDEGGLIETAYENLNWDRKFQTVPEQTTASKKESDDRAVLIIDDDPVSRAYLKKLLENQGYEVILAESGGQGCQLLETKRPQVVLLDWMMPGLDGMEFCRRVRKTPSLCSVYIIVLSMITGTESLVYALQTGADDYMSKPLHEKRQELLARIEVGFRIQKMQEKALQAQRLEGVLEMAGTVAHEINQPLMTMSGLIDLLFMDLEPDHPHTRVISRLKKQVKRLGKLTKKLNQITRYETVQYPDGIQILNLEKATGKSTFKEDSE